VFAFFILPSGYPDKRPLRAASVIVSLRWPFRFEGCVMGAPYKFVGQVRQEIADAYASGEPLKSIAARYGTDQSTVYRVAMKMGAAKRTAGVTKTAKIIELSQANPHLGPIDIAQIVGARVDFVGAIRRLCGFRGRIARKALRVIAASRENPTFGCERIAAIAGVSVVYAKEVRRKHGIRAQNYNFASASAPTLNQGGLQGLSQ